MVAYASNPKWYMPRLGRITPIHNDEVKARFFGCIDKMYDAKLVGQIRTKWTKFSTLRVYSNVVKMDIRTMA